MNKSAYLIQNYGSGNDIAISTCEHRIIAYVNSKELWLAQMIVDKINEKTKADETQAA